MRLACYEVLVLSYRRGISSSLELPRCALFNEPRFVELALGFFPLLLLCSQRVWNPSESHSVSSRTDGTSGQGVELTTYVQEYQGRTSGGLKLLSTYGKRFRNYEVT